jgi:hypothetical protein
MNNRELLSLQGVASLSLMFHGGVRLARVGGHVRAPTKSHKVGLYNSGGVSYLWCARGPCVSSADRGIRRCMHGILRAVIWCAIASISPLPAAVL